ncbi:contractile injection system tape measure protein [uncultured Algoriphagus sp.]|uniref:contractile injection system tape measure protein n=1 Tax=uncultured Algoriphagus sp. TaxID=417365 RepID=UPI0030EC52C3|tara:strand:+ start:23686 stop:25263 length:1578 start_codon:yes stop_codon:yes gene_type:complete
MASHLIHRQLIEANFQNKEIALSGQNLLQERYKNVLIPLMEQVFDEYSPKSWSLRIEKLELDLGRFPADLPEKMMRDRLRDVLEDQLRKIYLEKGILADPTSTSNFKKEKPGLSKIHSDWEKITFYLIHGRLPWWTSSKEKKSIQSLFNQVLNENHSLLKSWLKENPISLATAKRLSVLLTENELESIFQSGSGPTKQEFKLILNFLELLLTESILKKAEIRFWLSAVVLFSLFGRKTGLTSFIQSGFASLKTQEKKKAVETAQFLIFMSKFIVQFSSNKPASENGKIASESLNLVRNKNIDFSKVEKFLPSVTSFWKTVVENLISESLPKKELSTANNELEKLEFLENNLAQSKAPDLDELIVINNAGLVLTAAFLPRFFENLGLVKSGRFISDQAQLRAVVILQEMLGTDQEYDETDLILNKLLCGIPPAAALGLLPKITLSEKEEITSLLNSMAEQWTALKSRSGKMVSEGFFQREGSLRRVSKGYQLQIQRMPFDLLLDRLPWTIGMIKLPWMDELIAVEW